VDLFKSCHETVLLYVVPFSDNTR